MQLLLRNISISRFYEHFKKFRECVFAHISAVLVVLLYKCCKNLDTRILEIKCYFSNLIGQFISFMVCSRRREDYRIRSHDTYFHAEPRL